MTKKYYWQTVLVGLAITLSSVLAKAVDYRVPVGSCDAGGNYRTSSSYRLHDVIGQAVIGNWQSTNYKLAANLYPSLTSAQITLVSPSSGTVGSVVSVQGAYFNPTEPIRIDFGTTKSIAVCTTNSQGIFATIFTVDSKPQATYTITATGLVSGSIDEDYFFIIHLPIVSASDSPDPFSPEGDTVDDVCVFSLSATHPIGIASWTLTIYTDLAHTNLVKDFGAPGIPPAALTWDGRNNAGVPLPNAVYYYVFKAWNNVGASNTTTGTVEIQALARRSGSEDATAYNNGRRTVRDSDGNIHLVYHSSGEIYYTKSTDNGLNWSAPINLTNNSGLSIHPSLAIDSNNELHLVYEEFNSPRWEIFYWKSSGRIFTGVPTKLSGVNDANTPMLTIDDNNRIHLVYTEYFAGSSEIIYHKFDGSWSGPLNMSNSAGLSHSPSLATDSNNDVHLVWVEDGVIPGNGQILYRKTTAGIWQPGVTNVSNISGHSIAPCLVNDTNDDLHLVFENHASAGEILYKKQTGGIFGGTAVNLSNNAGNSYAPSISAGPTGTLHVCWFDDTAGNKEILYRNSVSGGLTFNPTENVSNSATASAYPNLGLKTGVVGADLVWIEGDSAPYMIKYQRLSPIAPVPPVNIRILPAETNSAVGSQFDVTVAVEAVTNLYGFELRLGYDPTILDVATITDGAFISSDGANSTWFKSTSTPGIAHAASSRYGTTTGVGGTGTLIGVRFTVLANIHHSTITINTAILKDNTLPVPQTIPVVLFAGRINIAPWDIDGDNVVNISDLSIVGIHFGETPSSPNWYPPADINSDGKVDITDLVIIGLHFGETYGPPPALVPQLSPLKVDEGMRLKIVPEVDTCKPGEAFKVEIKAEEVEDLYGYQFDVKFDKELVEVIEVKEGNFLNQDGASTFFIPLKIGEGVIKDISATRIQTQTGINGEGVLVVIYFKVKEGVETGKMKFAIENIILKDSSKPIPQTLPCTPTELNEEITIQTLLPPTDLTGVIAYPNPSSAGKEITFINLTDNVTEFKIYNLAGELVAQLNKAVKYAPPQATWAVVNDSGDKVASGVYLYVIIDGSGHKKVGKVAVIR